MSSASSRDGVEDEVLLEQNLHVKAIWFNRPKHLNALTTQMFSRLLDIYLASEEDDDVKLLILKGKGRAFCAGGDVSSVVGYIKGGQWKAAYDAFRKGYTWNYVIATHSKPQVSILHGIALGGGGTAPIHGRFRVATENTIFAMPEAALGLFPDAGASYFLSRLPGLFGEYVGLTGCRLDGAEMLACGLATHFVPLEKLPLLDEALCKVNTSDPNVISAIIDQFSHQPRLKENSSYRRLDAINNFFSQKTVEEIISTLKRAGANSQDAWISSTLNSLKTASPTSLKISLRSIREGRLQGLGQCIIREYRIACHVIRGEVSQDYLEGGRALLLDKDKNPKWQPSKLELVTDDMVNHYFSPVDDSNWEDLKLPSRPSLLAHAIAKL